MTSSSSPPYHLQQVKMAWGRVRHRRFKPKPNGFDTGALFVRLVFSSQTATEDLNTRSRWPLIDKPGLISVSGKHYGFEPHGLSLNEHVLQLQGWACRTTGMDLSGEVHLHTFPKVLGYVFNPVSFWYFHTPDARCPAILCEVNNTFGERHFYLLTNPDGGMVNKGQALRSDKVFHVSPFFPVSGEYEFRFMDSGSKTLARIHYWDQGELKLTTSVSGELVEPSNALWIKSLGRFGWSSLQVVVKIHWQALKLLSKGAKFHSKPTPPDQSLTQAKV